MGCTKDPRRWRKLSLLHRACSRAEKEVFDRDAVRSDSTAEQLLKAPELRTRGPPDLFTEVGWQKSRWRGVASLIFGLSSKGKVEV